jgi:hypothetical protein
VLKPVKLSVTERRCLYRKLTCPNCETAIHDPFYEPVATYTAEDSRAAQRVKTFERNHAKQFERFRRFILDYMRGWRTGFVHETGEVLELDRLGARNGEPGTCWSDLVLRLGSGRGRRAGCSRCRRMLADFRGVIRNRHFSAMCDLLERLGEQVNR